MRHVPRELMRSALLSPVSCEAHDATCLRKAHAVGRHLPARDAATLLAAMPDGTDSYAGHTTSQVDFVLGRVVLPQTGSVKHSDLQQNM